MRRAARHVRLVLIGAAAGLLVVLLSTPWEPVTSLAMLGTGGVLAAMAAVGEF